MRGAYCTSGGLHCYLDQIAIAGLGLADQRSVGRGQVVSGHAQLYPVQVRAIALGSRLIEPVLPGDSLSS